MEDVRQFMGENFAKPFLLSGEDGFFIQGNPDLGVFSVERHRETVYDFVLV